MLKVAAPAVSALHDARDAAAPYRMKTRLAARAGGSGKPPKLPVYRELSDSEEDFSDAPSTPPRRKQQHKTKAAVKSTKQNARPALPVPPGPTRPEPAVVWVEDEVSGWNARNLNLLDVYNAKQRCCLTKRPWPSTLAESAQA
ncbi:hypothetical protein EXIGLDRAFT_763707, partial [Exidia glandulosa HHB12029]